MDDDTQDTLARWYSPVRGLRLVWSLWVDPVWYWTHVSPRLDGRRPRVVASAQAVVGTFLVTLAMAAAAGLIAAAAGVPVAWGLLALVPPGAALMGLAISLFSHGVLSIGIWGVTCGVALSLAVGVTRGETWYPALSLALYGLAGLGGGVFAGVDWGRRLGVRGALPVAAVMGLLLFAQYGLALGLAGAALAAAGLLLGSRWATRQVPDAAARAQP